MDILLAMAIVPAAVLLYRVYKHDTVEKEPPRLLARLLLLGALSCIPAIILEMMGTNVIESLLPAGGMAYILAENFLVIAVSEEVCKFFFLRVATWKNPAFDYVFDGVVYAVFVSLGFAIFENIGYVMEFGPATAIVRAFTAIPGHAIFGVFMGCFYGLAKRAEHAGDLGRKSAYLLAALVVPVFCHGFYDFCASINSGFADLVFFAFLFAIMFIALRLMKRMSAEAHPVHSYDSAQVVQPGYPQDAAAPYNPYVDNSLDGGFPTYTAPNQYGGSNPAPPPDYPRSGSSGGSQQGRGPFY